MKIVRKIALALLAFYQKYLSILSHGSCRYYPTCSQYSVQLFETNSLFKAIYFTILRILTCNSLFDGGIDYPRVRKVFKNPSYKKIDVKYWYIPQNNDIYLIIKNWDYKK